MQPMISGANTLGGILAAAALSLCQAAAQTPVSNVGTVAAGVTGAKVYDARPDLSRIRPMSRPAPRAPVTVRSGAPLRPLARDAYLPSARWDDRVDGALWTRATMAALETHAPQLTRTVPRDIDTWCPAYADNPPELRRAFWTGLMSALAFYESRHDPGAVGGGNLWFGLLQIFPATARGYDCRADTGGELTDPEDNLSCGARILNVTVPRDRAVALHDGRWRGVAADWGPMTSNAKRTAMSAWTREQTYCQPQRAPLQVQRPVSRPAGGTMLGAVLSTSNVASLPPLRPLALSDVGF